MEKIQMGRRAFIASAAGALAAAKLGAAESAEAIRATLLHLGHNMWCEWIPDGMDRSLPQFAKGMPDLRLRSRDDLWRNAVDHAAAKGLNMVVIDLGEGVVYPSHPELAIEGSWSAEKLRAELDRMRKLGLEPIPKLNFSTTHNGWLKHYRRMLSTPTYYKVCEDVIRDACEIFGRPRFVHIGCDEETAEHQVNSGRCQFVTVRLGEFWKHDFLHLVGAVEKNGARAWAWADYGWDHPEFMKWCPKSVLLSNWYYDECHAGFDLATNKTPDHKRLKLFWDLAAAGYDQVPCGTNWAGWKRKRDKCGGDDVIGKLVKTCRAAIPPATLKGFMMASWASCDNEEHLAFINRGNDLFAEALAQ